MSDFQPIPGVWYVHPEEDVWYLYSPSYPDSEYPWWSNEAQHWLSDQDVPTDELEVMYNPHPPTLTEYRTEAKPGSRSLLGPGHPQSGEGALDYVSKEAEQTNRLVQRREVTEWQEVDQ